MKIDVYTEVEQGVGAFDGGAITEQKPIGFPGENSQVKRVGPLFYWAWAHAPVEGYIDTHPHQAFEILTYVIQGQANHGDSLGTNSVVGSGGAQLIQAGSGVYHNERLVGPDCELFQIWFEPYIHEAVKYQPSYRQFEHEQFPIKEHGAVQIKTIIGEGSPLDIVVDAGMWEIRLQPSAAYEHKLADNRSLAILAFRGSGSCTGITGSPGTNGESVPFQHKDFIVAHAEGEGVLKIQAAPEKELWLTIIEVPTEVEYPLYPKRS